MIHFIRFNVVGVLGFALQSGALFALTHRERPLGYLAATAAAVELAVLNNFVWHQRWTWSDRPSATTGETLRRLAKFNITNGAVSITGNLVLMSILDQIAGYRNRSISYVELCQPAQCLPRCGRRPVAPRPPLMPDKII